MARMLLPPALLFLLILASLAGDRPAPPADLSITNGTDVTTLDPHRLSWMQDLRASRLVFEGLVVNDVFSRDYHPIPGVAESWTISDDRLEYRFHLRADARWSNAEPIRASDFIFAWRRVMLPDTAADYFNFFSHIEGAREFFDWRTRALADFPARAAGLNAGDRAALAEALWKETLARFDSLVGLEAPSDRELVVRLVRPVPYFLDLCAFPSFFPVYPPLVAPYDRVDPSTARVVARPGWTQPERLVSNGPFVLTRWRFKRDMRFEANPLYWNADAISLRSIAIPSIADPAAQILAFQTGAVAYNADVTSGFRREMVAHKLAYHEEHRAQLEQLRAQGLDRFEIDRRLPDDPRAHTHVSPAFGTYFWNLNCRPTNADGTPNPLADPRVRRALALCVDKRLIADQVRGLLEPVARTLVPPGAIADYPTIEGLPCLSDCATPEERAALVARARALLAEAGWPNPADLPTVELLFNKDNGHDLIAQSLAKGWQESLGISVRLAQKEIRVFRDDLKKGYFDTSRAGWYGDYGDPLTFLDLSRTGDGNNDRGYANPDYDAILDRAAQETDPVARLRTLADAERIIMERDLPMIPIFHYNNVFMFNARTLSGPNPHPRTIEHIHLYDVLGDGIGAETPRSIPPDTAHTPASP